VLLKLVIRRTQEDKKGVFGGSKGITFSSTCTAAISPEDKAVLERARVMDYVVYERTLKSSDHIIKYTAKQLTDGIVITSGNVGELLAFEDAIKESASNLKTLIRIINTFGGEEVIEV
jgi:hypothetical protein